MPIVNKIKQNKILLDTHVLLWLEEGRSIFKKDFLDSIEEAREEERILISIITIWEVGMLESKKKIKLGMDCVDWIEKVINGQNLRLIPLSPKIAIESSRLPLEIHGDPADRILISTTYEEKAVLVTCDIKLLEYGKGKHIPAYDPSK